MSKPRSVVSAFLLLCLSSPVVAQAIPTPKEHLGFRPGDDYRLAQWEQVVDYFRKVDAVSDRVLIEELGATTLGRPYIVAVVSSPENMAKLDAIRAGQRRTADPRLPGEPNLAVPIVLITCSIHSSETASTLMAVDLLHQLAVGTDAATKEILDNTILLLVPSANPDGVDIVAQWYEKTKGRPWEGSGLPELYHPIAGHDTNRDWFMLNLQETRLLTRFLYDRWFPTITYDVHQMGSRGARMFVPPFFDPVNPNLDPRLSQSIALIGAHMALDLAKAGKRGVLTNAMYDNWWNGGNRTVPQRHNMVGLLTEAASVRLASPIFLEASDLRGEARGFANHKPTVNFVDPWPGGWWRLRDIVEYELICSRAVLTLAARYRSEFQKNYRDMAGTAIEKGKTEPPYGWIVPADQRDPGATERMLRALMATGIEIHRSPEPIELAGMRYPAGSWILPAAQPYRSHLKDMMERQEYPTRFGPDGNAEPPYDVAGWTMPLKMGVRAATLTRPLAVPGKPLETIEIAGTIVDAPGKSKHSDSDVFTFNADTVDGVRLLNRLHPPGQRVASMREVVLRSRPAARVEGRRGPTNEIEIDATPANETFLRELLEQLAVRVTRRDKGESASSKVLRAAPRVGLYHSHVPSMDEGWTRFVLEEHGFVPMRITNTDVRAGRLVDRIDVLVIASMSSDAIANGQGRDRTAPEFVGGLGADAVLALRDFVTAGGTLICLENSCKFAIDRFGLPVESVLDRLESKVFYCPGSILRAEATRLPCSFAVDPALGMPDEFSVYFDRSLAFESKSDLVVSHARYAKVNPLESGWLLGSSKLEGKSALVSVAFGQGRIVLFGFPPQHRGQTHGTYPLLFRAILQESF